MTGSEMLAEVGETFPARDVVTDIKRHPPVWVGINTAICKECGKEFSYWPSSHVYRAHYKHRHIVLCSWHCLKAFRETHRTDLDKRIEHLQERMDYLMAQADLPPEQREIKRGLDRMIETVNQRLNTALNKKARGEED